MARVLLTGAAGFIGSHLAERLVAQGHEVLGVDAFTEYYDPRVKETNLQALQTSSRFQLVRADLVTTDLESLVDTCEVICHLAGEPGVRTSWGAEFRLQLERNVLTTQRLLEVARGRSLRKFVFASSSSVYGESGCYPTGEDELPRPASPYGVTKLAAERLCLVYHASYDVPTVILRYFSVYGPRQRPDMAFSRFIRAIDAGEPVPLYGDGHQTRDFTFVADAVEATLASVAADVTGEVLNVGGGARVTVLEVLRELGRVMQREVVLNPQPCGLGDVQNTGADLTRIHRALGYSPTVRLSDGLREQVAWARANGVSERLRVQPPGKDP
jgi:UDP-glucose 4-epimerase